MKLSGSGSAGRDGTVSYQFFSNIFLAVVVVVAFPFLVRPPCELVLHVYIISNEIKMNPAVRAGRKSLSYFPGVGTEIEDCILGQSERANYKLSWI